MPEQVKTVLSKLAALRFCCTYPGPEKTRTSFDCKGQLHISGNTALILMPSQVGQAKISSKEQIIPRFICDWNLFTAI